MEFKCSKYVKILLKVRPNVDIIGILEIINENKW